MTTYEHKFVPDERGLDEDDERSESDEISPEMANGLAVNFTLIEYNYEKDLVTFVHYVCDLEALQ